jgi:hypothetical protein
MGQVYVTSDLHLGSGATALRRGFASSLMHDETIVGNIIGTLPRRSKLYILGDVGHGLGLEKLVDGIKAKHAKNPRQRGSWSSRTSTSTWTSTTICPWTSTGSRSGSAGTIQIIESC